MPAPVGPADPRGECLTRLREGGLRAEETWYLGDTVVFDAAGADAAGLTPWVID